MRPPTSRLSRDLRDLQRYMSAPLAQGRLGLAARAIGSPADWRLLDELIDGETWNVVKLAKRLEVNHSTVSRQIVTLQNLRLVSISTAESDRRRRVVQLTAFGREMVMDLRRARAAILDHILAQWPDNDAQNFCRLFARFAKDTQTLTLTFDAIAAGKRE